MTQQDNTTRILVADGDGTTRQLLARVLGAEGIQATYAATGDELWRALRAQFPHLLILNVALAEADAFAICRRVRQHATLAALPILMLADREQDGQRLSAFQAGTDDYIVKPLDPTELLYRLKRLMARAALVPGSTALQPRGRVIAVFGTKGGIGKTTLAVNLAVALSQQTRRRVALFDADFPFGAVGVYLNLPPVRSVANLIGHIRDLEPEMFEQVLVRHSSGVHVLQSPTRPENIDLISGVDTEQLVRALGERFDYIVVDCQSNYDERTLTILERADQILFVVVPEVSALKNARFFLELAEKLGLEQERFQIVLNRAETQSGIDAQMIEQTLQAPVAFRIASGGRAVVASANRGEPLTLTQPRHLVARQIKQIADALVRSAANAPRTRRVENPLPPPARLPSKILS